MPIRDSLPSIPTWSQTKTASKAGFDKVYAVVDKLGPPVNRLSNKLGSEAFWPTTLDIESDKAARILRSFCKDGFYVEEEKEGQPKKEDGVPKGKQRVIKKIPTEVIKRAKGLAIFTTMRTGLWVSGAGGSGVPVARKADGSWSPPSGIMLHTAGLGFLVGVDIYDCVVVINTEKALEAFTKIRCTLGGEVSAVAGPVGIGGLLETEVHKRQAPVWNYLKSRGFYAGVQIDGTVIIERTDENERFYGERIPVADILAGKVRHPPREIQGLMQTIKSAQGDKDVDETVLPSAEPTPGDYEVSDSASNFGLPPSEDDPDPFGVHALEEQGMEIREAGTRQRPSGDAFEYNPSPKSPIYATFHSRKNSKRDSSRLSMTSIRTDQGTQTDDLTSDTRLVDSPREVTGESPVRKATENLAEDNIDDGSSGSGDEAHHHQVVEAQPATVVSKPQPATVVSKAKLVTIPKRVPPALPPRNPHRRGMSTASSTPGSPIVSSPLHEEQGAQGLGIALDGGDNTADADATDSRPASLFPIPSHSSIEERLEQVHLAPTSPSPSRSRPTSRDGERHLSPLGRERDGFDDVSVSGSDYSRPTPGDMTPAYEKEGTLAHEREAEEPSQNTIIMEDKVDGNEGAGLEDTPHLAQDGFEGPVHVHGEEGKATNEPADQKAAVRPISDDFSMPGEFHSMPGTPGEPADQPDRTKEQEPARDGVVEKVEKKDEEKDDFA